MVCSCRFLSAATIGDSTSCFVLGSFAGRALKDATVVAGGWAAPIELMKFSELPAMAACVRRR